MNRRDFLRIAGTFSVVSLTSYGSGVAQRLTAKMTRPNLLIIQTDEHNFRTLGCYRKTLPVQQAYVWGENVAVETPHIDWLAEHGALCTSFYATTPVCSPSRSAWVSGRYPQNTPVITNDIPMDDEIITFAEILRQQGYETGYAGKWHLDGLGRPQWAPERQFGFADNRYMFNRGHWKQLEDTPQGPRVAARNNGKPTYSIAGADKKNFTTDFLADKTIEFIQTHKEKSFCYMVSLPDPHGPNSVRAPYDTMYKHLNFQKPATGAKPDKDLPIWGKKSRKTISADGMAKYFGMVKCIDDNVGKIIETLKHLKLMDHTIVVFTSDHGDLCGEHGRDNKGVPYEASAKIPFVLYYPAKVKPRTLIHETLTCVDFLPTILSLMNVTSAGKEQGRNASSLFVDGKAPADWKDVAFMRGTGQRNGKDDDNWLAVVTHRYKLVYSPQDPPWLFDLEKDPDELINIYQKPEYKETVKKLAQELLVYGKKYNDPRINVPHIRNELEQAMQSETK
jgi:arylsulfatase A-like enzyme